MRGRAWHPAPPDDLRIESQQRRFSDDARALREATQAFAEREKELLHRIAQIEKELRVARSDAALAMVVRTNTLPAGSYREQVNERSPLSLPRMASRNARRVS